MTDSRALAAETLQNILTKRTFFSEEKNAQIAESRDFAFINMLVLTGLRRYVFLKKILHKYAKKKLPPKAAFAEHALLLGIAELLFLDTPDYAVINSWVDIIKKKTDKFVSGFANAVLRKAAADKETLLAEDAGEFFPSGFYRILNSSYGKKTVAKIQKAALIEPLLDITVKEAPEIWAEKLDGKALANGSVRLPNRGKITALEGYDEGAWWIQDVAASLAVQSLGNISGQRVLDICAAPGGKTAQLLNAGAKVTALDISASRLEILKSNLARLKMTPQEIVCADGLAYLNDFQGEKYDIILLDAPCSATGTLRRHPETVHIKTIEDIERQTALQKEFLTAAEKALKPGGILLYCTCSISKAEGENQIAEFLAQNSGFKLMPITQTGFAETVTPEGFIRTLPYHLAEEGGMDAFFVAKLRKES